MKIWQWFCQLCTTPTHKKITPKKKHTPKDTATGTEVCSRICGHNSCHCGGTMRGLYCIWSHYQERE